MEINIAACGLICSKCDAFVATRLNDPAKLELVAADWRKRYKCDAITAGNIRCTGCMTEGGPKCGHCENGCQVRKCAMKKGVSVCGECAEYPCAVLNELHGYMGDQAVPQKKMLEAIGETEKKMHSVF